MIEMLVACFFLAAYFAVIFTAIMGVIVSLCHLMENADTPKEIAASIFAAFFCLFLAIVFMVGIPMYCKKNENNANTTLVEKK